MYGTGRNEKGATIYARESASGIWEWATVNVAEEPTTEMHLPEGFDASPSEAVKAVRRFHQCSVKTARRIYAEEVLGIINATGQDLRLDGVTIPADDRWNVRLHEVGVAIGNGRLHVATELLEGTPKIPAPRKGVLVVVPRAFAERASARGDVVYCSGGRLYQSTTNCATCAFMYEPRCGHEW